VEIRCADHETTYMHKVCIVTRIALLLCEQGSVGPEQIPVIDFMNTVIILWVP
jgi:hypothetical protein